MTDSRSHQNGSVPIAELLERVAAARYPHLQGEAAEDNESMFGQWFERGIAQDEWSQCIKEECARGLVAVRDADYGVPVRPEGLDDSQWKRCLVSRHDAEAYIRRFGNGEWQPLPAQSAEPSAGPCDTTTSAPAPTSTAHRLSGSARPLAAEIAEAKKRATDPHDSHSVWAELGKMAEQEFGAMIGYSSDGVQYRGKKYEKQGTWDVFTLKNLRDRMGRARKRAKAREGA